MSASSAGLGGTNSKWGQYVVWYGHYGTPAVNGRAKHNRTYCSYCCTIRGSADTPSVIQRARPVVSIEQTMQSTAVYGTLLYVSDLPYTAPLPYAAYTAPLPSTAPLPCLLCQQGLLSQWVIMVRAISSLLCLTPIGCLRESRCYNISSFRNGSSLKLGELAKPSLSLSPPISSSGLPIKVGDDVEIISGRSASAKRARPEDQAKDKANCARSTSTSRRSPSPKRDYNRGTCTATRPSQASTKRAEHRPAPAQDVEAFEADMTSML